jgi:uncharacterized protein (DUF433 family)
MSTTGYAYHLSVKYIELEVHQGNFATKVCYHQGNELEALMKLVIVAESAPLKANEDGVVLVGKTRVTLDTVVTVFMQGTTAEEIVYRYPSLNLADVYATIAFYLNHQPEVEVYLQQRRLQSQEIRAMNQARFDPQGLRDRLLARKTTQEAC